MPIEIDISGVPVEKRTHPDFLKLSRQMQAALDNPKWQAAFTIHEAGHRIYLSRLEITDFRFIGPRIIYDEQKNDFDGYPVAAKAEPVPLSAEGFDFNKWLVQLAQAKAAGGVFSRRLTAAPDNGDAEDREEFSRACELLRGKLPDQQIDGEKIWKQAEENILKDLRSPGFHRKCWEEANEIKRRLHPNPGSARTSGMWCPAYGSKGSSPLFSLEF